MLKILGKSEKFEERWWEKQYEPKRGREKSEREKKREGDREQVKKEKRAKSCINERESKGWNEVKKMAKSKRRRKTQKKDRPLSVLLLQQTVARESGQIRATMAQPKDVLGHTPVWNRFQRGGQKQNRPKKSSSYSTLSPKVERYYNE